MKKLLKKYNITHAELAEYLDYSRVKISRQASEMNRYGVCLPFYKDAIKQIVKSRKQARSMAISKSIEDDMIFIDEYIQENLKEI